ncbi:MAG: AAA family ATPase [Rubrivivax sp.]|nr:AAA family ATPase [Rubrivivax sp.]
MRASGSERLLGPHRVDQLLAYLACRGRWIPRAELAELFWPGRPEGSARANLRVLLQRARRLQPTLELQAERVRWTVSSDLARLDAAAAEGDDATVVALASAPLLEGLEPGLPESLLEWLRHERERLQSLMQAAVARRNGGAGSPAPHRPHVEPAGDAGFIGRRQEIADSLARLDAGLRVLVLCGPGGIGKSALLRALLPALAARHDGGARAVALADLRELSQVPGRIAQALGVALRADADAWDQLGPALDGRRCLLALDNAEHLPGLAERLEQLLASHDGLRLLLSSRVRMSFTRADVATLVLEGLPLPDDDERDPQLLRHFDAVRLFEARAAAAGNRIELPRSAAALQRLLRATEGLPLALELAAAATRLVPLDQLADELQRSIAVLDAGRPVSGLRACFEQSWALLDPALQRSLAALAWLPGPADRALAMAVAELSLDGLATLVDHSLLRVDGQGRCGLHPLLRQWLLERVDAGQREALAARHAAQVGHRLAAIDGADPQAAAAALRALDADLPHVVQAWGWQVERGSPALQARFARVMGQYFVARGGTQAILPFLEHAAGAIAAGSRAGLAARALTRRTQAMLEYHGGDLAAAEAHAREALRWARQAGDRSTALACLTVLGNALVFAGRGEEARAPLEQAARRALAAGDPRLAGAALNALGLLDRAAGRFEEALARFGELAAVAERSRDFPGQMTALINAGNIEGLLQRWDAARHTTLRALACAEAGGMEGERALLHTILAEIALETGDRASAGDHIAHAEAALPRSTATVLPTQLRLMQMNLALLEGRDHDAAQALATAWRAARDSRSWTMQLSCLNAAGRWRATAGDTAGALVLWCHVRDHPQASRSLRDSACRHLGEAGHAADVPAPVRPPDALSPQALLEVWLDTVSIRPAP